MHERFLTKIFGNIQLAHTQRYVATANTDTYRKDQHIFMNIVLDQKNADRKKN